MQCSLCIGIFARHPSIRSFCCGSLAVRASPNSLSCRSFAWRELLCTLRYAVLGVELKSIPQRALALEGACLQNTFAPASHTLQRAEVWFWLPLGSRRVGRGRCPGLFASNTHTHIVSQPGTSQPARLAASQGSPASPAASQPGHPGQPASPAASQLAQSALLPASRAASQPARIPNL